MNQSLTQTAVQATLHCLTGCAIGEILGLIIGTAFGLGPLATTGVAVALAFVFGYLLTTLPLRLAGLTWREALKLALLADTVSIATMEVVDNAVMLVVPGAMTAGLVTPVFWLSLTASLVIAFAAAVPVNRWLIARGRGHAVVHGYHEADHAEKEV